MARPVEWEGLYFAGTTASAGLSVIDIEAASKFETEYDDPTIIRIVGNLHFRLNANSNTASETTRFGVGLGVFAEQLPAAAMDPRDMTRSWLWIAAGEVFDNVNSTPTVVGGAQRIWREEFDVRGMRKVRDGETLRLGIWVNHTAGSPGALAIGGCVRCLVKS